jgi:hypothetical protein
VRAVIGELGEGEVFDERSEALDAAHRHEIDAELVVIVEEIQV